MQKMASLNAESIDSSGFPLVFKARQGRSRPDSVCAMHARDVFVVEARQFSKHQKEAVVTEGAAGSSWRIVSDEGLHLTGTDLAPFPLGYFNAGLHADLINRILQIATARNITLDKLEIDLRNGYSMTGAFYRGDGKGYAEPARVKVNIDSPAAADQIAKLVADAVKASPAMATMQQPVTNTFAIYVNGHRRMLTNMNNSVSQDAVDPFVTHARAPQPLSPADDARRWIQPLQTLVSGTRLLLPSFGWFNAYSDRQTGGRPGILPP